MSAHLESVAVTIRSGRPLAPMQRPLWASQRRHPESAVQNMALLSHIDGPVDPVRMAEAFRESSSASDALRTTMDEDARLAAVRLNPRPAADRRRSR